MAVNRREALKKALFDRDGWRLAEGCRVARCAFGCGRLLVKSNATIDRYPIPGRDGGTYHLDNARLACASCNSEDGKGKRGSVRDVVKQMSTPQQRAYRRALRHPGNRTQITPEQFLEFWYEQQRRSRNAGVVPAAAQVWE